MARTKPCRACGEPVSTEAKACPHCGQPTLWSRFMSFINTLAVLAVVAVIIAFCAGSGLI